MTKFLGTVALVVVALGALSFGKKEETLEQLIERAKAARPDQQAGLYMEIAERQVKSAMDASKANQHDAFRAQLKDAVDSCDKAHAAALHTNKHIKSTEIKIRRISSHLQNIKLDMDIDDQAPVQAAVDQLETFRTELLKGMFGAKSND
jgi:hypothetical protein